jgi:hypothetical protein
MQPLESARTVRATAFVHLEYASRAKLLLCQSAYTAAVALQFTP